MKESKSRKDAARNTRYCSAGEAQAARAGATLKGSVQSGKRRRGETAEVRSGLIARAWSIENVGFGGDHTLEQALKGEQRATRPSHLFMGQRCDLMGNRLWLARGFCEQLRMARVVERDVPPCRRFDGRARCENAMILQDNAFMASVSSTTP
jgi:hypothetical protein